MSCLQDRQPKGSSEREREGERERGREKEKQSEQEGERKRETGSDGYHGYFLEDVSTLVYLWAAGACVVAPLTEQMCVRWGVCLPA